MAPSPSEPESVIGVLQLQAERQADAPFLVDGATEWTYGDVFSLSRRRATAFADMGIGRGDTVAFYMENSAEQAISSFAVNMLGGIWSPANIDYRGEWLATTLSDIASDVLVVDAHLLPRVTELSNMSFKHVIVNGVTDAPAPGATTRHAAGFNGRVRRVLLVRGQRRRGNHGSVVDVGDDRQVQGRHAKQSQLAAVESQAQRRLPGRDP